MPRARSVATILSAVALAGPAAAFGQGAGGAGDDQYQDPFSGSSGSQTSGSSTTSQTSDNGLSQDPNLGTGTSSGTSGSSSTSSGTSTASTTGTSLPNTGSDPRLIILAGLALLLSGLGLRLRTADERF